MNFKWNGYADRALNLIVGCSNESCPCRSACWAKRMAARNKRCVKCQAFEPHFHLERMRNFRKPQVIALNFMGDWLDPFFTTRISTDISAIKLYILDLLSKKHTLLTLTKKYASLAHGLERALPHPNGWHGISITSETDILAAIPHWQKIPQGFKRWISFEPLLGEVAAQSLAQLMPLPDQIVIGAQTRPRVNPPWLSVEHIIAYCSRYSVPLFVKDNMPEHVTRFHQLAWERRRV